MFFNSNRHVDYSSQSRQLIYDYRNGQIGPVMAFIKLGELYQFDNVKRFEKIDTEYDMNERLFYNECYRLGLDIMNWKAEIVNKYPNYEHRSFFSNNHSVGNSFMYLAQNMNFVINNGL